jgi:hypothetical protein
MIIFKEDMNNTRFEMAQDFIWKNARLLDRKIFSYLFCFPAKQPAARKAVVAALKAYQNPDGGLGNGLEADMRCPDSQPIAIDFGLGILDLVDALEDAQTIHEVVLPLCDYLVSIASPQGGVPTVLEPVNHYPHAPWWEISAPLPATLNPTAIIAGLLLKHHLTHPWLTKAEAFCWSEISAFESTAFHDVMPVIAFLEHAHNRSQAQIELERIAQRISKPGVVHMDPTASGYIKTPIHWAPTPQSFCRKLFDDTTLSLHLSALADQQQPDGGWPINWETTGPGVTLEWRGWSTILALHTLKTYEDAGFKV